MASLKALVKTREAGCEVGGIRRSACSAAVASVSGRSSRARGSAAARATRARARARARARRRRRARRSPAAPRRPAPAVVGRRLLDRVAHADEAAQPARRRQRRRLGEQARLAETGLGLDRDRAAGAGRRLASIARRSSPLLAAAAERGASRAAAVGPRRPSGRYAVIGRDLPLTVSSSGAPYSIRGAWPPPWSASQSTLTASLPSPDVDRRAATLTKSPEDRVLAAGARCRSGRTARGRWRRRRAAPAEPAQRVRDRERGPDAALRVVGVGVRRQAGGGEQARAVVVDADLVELRLVALEVGLQRDHQVLQRRRGRCRRRGPEGRRRSPSRAAARPSTRLGGGLVGEHGRRDVRARAPPRSSSRAAAACGR